MFPETEPSAGRGLFQQILPKDLLDKGKLVRLLIKLRSGVILWTARHLLTTAASYPKVFLHQDLLKSPKLTGGEGTTDLIPINL